MEENNLNILTNDVPNNEVLENGFVGETSISQENMGVNPISDIEVVSEGQPEVVAETYQSQEVMQPVESSNMPEIVENNNVATVMNQESYNSNSEMLSENMVVEPQAISEEIPTNINNVQEQNSTEAQPAVTEVKVSGTASEEEILRDATKPPVEVLDEFEIKKSVTDENTKYKKNTMYIVIIFALIIAFIIAMPYIIKMIGY